MKKYKQLLCIMMVVAIMLVMPFSSSAEGVINETDAGIITALQNTETIKQEMGLGSIDFCDIEIGNAITTYECTNNGILENDIMHPLMVNDELIAWAIEYEVDSVIYYQITTFLVDEIKDNLDDNDAFAILYDRGASYAYTGDELIRLKEFSNEIEDRIVLKSVADLSDDDMIELSIMGNARILGYVSPPMPRVQVYYSCNVSFVTQYPPSEMCWAASIACIVNYKKGTNLTAIDVAKMVFGSTNYDHTGSENDCKYVLNTKYGLGYSTKSRPSDGVLLRNIQNKYPILAVFTQGTSVNHAVVIYGLHTTAGHVNIMDPAQGFISTSSRNSSNVITYRDGGGSVMTLVGIISKYTTA